MSKPVQMAPCLGAAAHVATLRLRHLATLLAALLLSIVPATSHAQTTPGRAGTDTVLYDIRFPNAAQREAEVTVRWERLPAAPLVVRMSRSSPGRYALHEFAKNVYNLRAADESGRPLRIDRISPHAWRVTGHRGRVILQYTLFADRADGTYAGIDVTRAHLNIPATFIWAPGTETRPIRVTFNPAGTDWRIATQLEPTRDPKTFRARNLQYFMDSPTHLGALDLRERQVTSGGRTQTIRLALNHEGSAADATAFTEMTKKVVAEAGALFGEFPAFDFGSYTFIACYRSNCAGDGMEHRNSTSLTSSNAIATSAMQLLGTVSHEFVHAWNVERIRPRSLEPFDLTEANMSGELWIAEGFTNYLGPLIIARAGLFTTEVYARRLSGAVNTLTTSPARQFAGAMGMSQQAPFVDAATSIDPHNRVNTFISYYTYGEALGLALDLTLRGRPTPATLDDFFRVMWQRHGKAQSAALAPMHAYTARDAERALAATAHDSVFARDFFWRYVEGSELPDFPRLLDQAGFLVRAAHPSDGWIGDPQLSASEGRVVVSAPTLIGSPLYEAGVGAGDRILIIDDVAMTTAEQVRAAVAARLPGEALRLSWIGRVGAQSNTIRVRADPRVEVVAFEEAGRGVSPAQLAFRKSWLGSRQ